MIKKWFKRKVDLSKFKTNYELNHLYSTKSKINKIINNVNIIDQEVEVVKNDNQNLQNKLNNEYYNKTEVDNKDNAIKANFNNYYTKREVDDQNTALNSKITENVKILTTKINTNTTNINTNTTKISDNLIEINKLKKSIDSLDLTKYVKSNQKNTFTAKQEFESQIISTWNPIDLLDVTNKKYVDFKDNEIKTNLTTEIQTLKTKVGNKLGKDEWIILARDTAPAAGTDTLYIQDPNVETMLCEYIIKTSNAGGNVRYITVKSYDKENRFYINIYLNDRIYGSTPYTVYKRYISTTLTRGD